LRRTKGAILGPPCSVSSTYCIVLIAFIFRRFEHRLHSDQS